MEPIARTDAEMLHAEDRADLDEWGHMGVDDLAPSTLPPVEPDPAEEDS
jgi:hypothetical protein